MSTNISAIFDFSRAASNAEKGDPVSQIYMKEEEIKEIRADIDDLKMGLSEDDKERMNSMYSILKRRDAALEYRAQKLEEEFCSADSRRFNPFDSFFDK